MSMWQRYNVPGYDCAQDLSPDDLSRLWNPNQPSEDELAARHARVQRSGSHRPGTWQDWYAEYCERYGVTDEVDQDELAIGIRQASTPAPSMTLFAPPSMPQRIRRKKYSWKGSTP